MQSAPKHAHVDPRVSAAYAELELERGVFHHAVRSASVTFKWPGKELSAEEIDAAVANLTGRKGRSAVTFLDLARLGAVSQDVSRDVERHATHERYKAIAFTPMTGRGMEAAAAHIAMINRRTRAALLVGYLVVGNPTSSAQAPHDRAGLAKRPAPAQPARVVPR